MEHNISTKHLTYLVLNEPLGAEGPPLVGEEVRKEEVGKVGSW